MEDVIRQPSPGGARRKIRDLPLFAHDDLQISLESAIGARLSIALTPDDTIEQVRTKERSLSSLNRSGGPLERWKAAANTWCAAWLTRGSRAPGRATFRAVLDSIVSSAGPLPKHVAEPLVALADAAAAAARVFHWTFEFPEIFHDEHGTRLPDGGFDVVVGNPPWDMLRDDGGRSRSTGLQAFVRDSAVYNLQGHGHGNLYQLFVERSLQLLKPAGRGGLILPSGFGTDESCARLRRFLFDRTSVDTFTNLENRDAIFPIHRGLKFLLLTFTHAGSTTALPVRAAVRSPAALDLVPDTGDGPGTIAVPRALVARISGDSLAVPDVRTARDLEIATAVAFQVPPSGDRDGWHVRFGRELNATEDRPHFTASGPGLPIVEGKQIRPFGVDALAARYRLPAGVASQLLDPDRTYRRSRLAYRDVASATNRTTLIAAIVPAGVVTTHTLFCLKDSLDAESQQYLCGVFNSYVANYLVRMRVGTHVSASIIARLPVPKPPSHDAVFQRVAGLSLALSTRFDDVAFARLNAVVAGLYGLSHAQFAHVLETFPLVPSADRALALRMFAGEKKI